MDNYWSSSYPYSNSPRANQGYPQPDSDATSQSYPQQYPHPHPYPTYPYPPPPRPTSWSGPLPYRHPAWVNPSQPYQYPQSSFPHAFPAYQHHNSFHYDPGHQQPYHDSLRNSQVPSRVDSFSNHQGEAFRYGVGNGSSDRNDYLHGTADADSHAPVYPHLDDLLSDLHLNDNRPSAPAYPHLTDDVHRPGVPAAPTAPPNAPGYGGNEYFYGCPNDSFSSTPHVTYLSQVDSHLRPSTPGYPHSSSFTSPPHTQCMQIVPSPSPINNASLRVCLLHGNLDIWVYDAKNLPNMDMIHKTLGDVFGKLPGNITTKIEKQTNRMITSDPYVSISVSGAVIGRTFVISNCENPVWTQHFSAPVAHSASEVQFIVKDSDVVGSQLIGTVAIPAEQIYSGKKIEGIFPILSGNGKPCKPGAVLKVSVQYIPMEKLSFYSHGVGAGPDLIGVPGTYFPLRKGGNVILYQDAHVPEGCLPSSELANGFNYVHGKCWSDIFDAVRQARRLIYITGWSVWHNVKLVRDRDSPHPSEVTLGHLLKSKSQEGARVLLLIWDDPTSRNILGYKTDGIMATHDEETRRFFKHSSVQVLLCPRIAGKRHSWVKQREVGSIYTHHQKTVIADADAGYGRRKIVAFVGGLDLCDGRYDNPHHSLFRTLKTLHKEDYHNPIFTGVTAGCPREPWHDLHCRIDGPAAYDVLTNFEERWMKAAKPHGISKLKTSYDDSLLRINRIPDIIGFSDLPSSFGEDDPETWHVQIFRSIDSTSVKGFPKDPKEATSKNLVCGKNILIDMSIHTAYVKAIRAAQHFIYIENQYFIGSSYNWTSYKDLGANNLIPMEIALKIANKIRAKERFAAYIVVPMWPEGIPTGAATQRILFWQHNTMQMMYETIHSALVEVGLQDRFTPEDYLNFFCLGNRERSERNDTSVISTPNAAVSQALSRKNRRFMIYVHSKGMIVDDEYVILGSANINQRSMEGTRDTEIAMGAYQPRHTWARNHVNPQGQIYGYRMSLWAEHMGVVEDCFAHPETVECVRRVRTMGDMNWRQFVADDVTDMKGHLLKYPVEVDATGKVRSLPKHETFPDVGGIIIGSFIAIQENLTI